MVVRCARRRWCAGPGASRREDARRANAARYRCLAGCCPGEGRSAADCWSVAGRAAASRRALVVVVVGAVAVWVVPPQTTWAHLTAGYYRASPAADWLAWADL